MVLRTGSLGEPLQGGRQSAISSQPIDSECSSSRCSLRALAETLVIAQSPLPPIVTALVAVPRGLPKLSCQGACRPRPLNPLASLGSVPSMEERRRRRSGLVRRRSHDDTECWTTSLCAFGTPRRASPTRTRMSADAAEGVRYTIWWPVAERVGCKLGSYTAVVSRWTGTGRPGRNDCDWRASYCRP